MLPDQETVQQVENARMIVALSALAPLFYWRVVLRALIPVSRWSVLLSAAAGWQRIGLA